MDKVILYRIKDKQEPIKLSYGKLMERLLTIKMLREGIQQRRYWGEPPARTENPTKAPFLLELIPMAEKLLKSITLALAPPVVVIGDRSGSMEVAIRTSTIIASLLTAITSAKLVFFDDSNMDAAFIPTNIEEVGKHELTMFLVNPS